MQRRSIAQCQQRRLSVPHNQLVRKALVMIEVGESSLRCGMWSRSVTTMLPAAGVGVCPRRASASFCDQLSTELLCSDGFNIFGERFCPYLTETARPSG